MVVRGKGKTATLYIGGGIELFRILLFTSDLKGLNNYSSNYFKPEKHDCFLTTFIFCFLLYLFFNTQSYCSLFALYYWLQAPLLLFYTSGKCTKQ